MNIYRLLCGVCLLILMCPMLSQAEIYKWVENGTVRYSDTPPPANIKPEVIKKKPAKSTEAVPAPPAVAPDNNTGKKKISAPEQLDKEMQEAKIRQQNADAEKKKKQEQEEQAKIKEKNCISARANYETYKQGGRISQVNENGEKSYMGDSDIKSGLAKAQADIDQYCS